MLDKEKVSKWYKQGLWTEFMVQMAVIKGKITEDDAKEILESE